MMMYTTLHNVMLEQSDKTVKLIALHNHVCVFSVHTIKFLIKPLLSEINFEYYYS